MCFLQFNWCCEKQKRHCNENKFDCNEHNSRFRDCDCREREFNSWKKQPCDDDKHNNSNRSFYKCVTLCCRNVYNNFEDDKKDDCKKDWRDCDCDKREHSSWNF